jgi:DNA-directed RNA polymerase subunit M/transcription elongation factor TFIIS
MPIFCPNTGQLLVPVVQNGTELQFYSPITNVYHPAEPTDSLRFDEKLNKSNKTISTIQLKNAIDDNTNTRKIAFCPSCKELAIITYIQNGAEMECINTCNTCKFQYPEL